MRSVLLILLHLNCLAQRCTGSKKTTLDCPHRYLEYLADLLVIQALQIPEHQKRPVVGIQGLECHLNRF